MSIQDCGSKKPEFYTAYLLTGKLLHSHKRPFLIRKSGVKTVHTTAEICGSPLATRCVRHFRGRRLIRLPLNFRVVQFYCECNKEVKGSFIVCLDKIITQCQTLIIFQCDRPTF
jgi:hypothetical protein